MRDSHSAGVVLTPMHGIRRDKRRTFRNSVAFAYLYTESIKVVYKLGTERCTAANDILKFSAERIKNILEYRSATIYAYFTKRI